MGKRKNPGKDEGRERPTARAIRACVVDPHCLEDLQWFAANEPRVAAKALDLIESVLRDPFTGAGKPEPLKGLAANTWSRRITGEHRLVYVVSDTRINFLMARYHYG